MNTCVFSSSSLVAGPEKPGSGPNRSRHGSRPARREARSRRASEASSEGLARAGAAGNDTGPERPLTEEAEREGCWKRCVFVYDAALACADVRTCKGEDRMDFVGKPL